MKFPKIETLVIFIFFACVAVWAVSKCTAERAEFVRKTDGNEQENRPAQRDTSQLPPAPPPVNVQSPSAAVPPVTTTPAPQPSAKPARPTLSNQPAQSPPPSNDNYSTLYATIDGLKVRKEPGLKGETLAKLALYEPVFFLNKKTEWTQEISLGREKVTDHWVKIRTQSGKEGWVFGAGVHYYKMKRQGVIE
jgi:hypothetical protein